MTINRDSLLGKIRALLSKTAENGCTEQEALAALAKARAMMDAYEVTPEDLKLTAEEAAVILREAPGSRDPHNIKSFLGVWVADFCECKVWKGEDGLVFCGLPADAQFAQWLIDTLSGFVLGELSNHLMTSIAPKGRRRFIINGFVSGCTGRINARLKELTEQSKRVASSNSRALVVVKSTAVAEKMKAAGIMLGKSRSSRRRMDGASYAAGKTAGDRASFGRPVGGGHGALIGKG